MDTVKVIFVDTNVLDTSKILSSHYLLDKDIASLRKFKNEQTKKEKAYSLILKNKYADSYYISEFGKPLSDKCYFNISHSNGVVVFVKANLLVGIDIENIKEIKENMVNYVSSDEEKDYIKDDKSFFEIWTNKESLTKCIGTGIKEKIKDIPALPINGVKEYKNKVYYGRTIEYKGNVISLVRETKEPFDIAIEEE